MEDYPRKWGIHFIQVHPMGCGLAAPEQECEIARIVRVAAKPTHTRIHCGGCRILGDGRLSPEFGRVRGAFR